MAFGMIRPSRHPRTGIYRLRLAIPRALMATAVAMFGCRHELIENLGVKDPRDAKRLAGPAISRLLAKLEAVRAAAAGDAPSLTERDAQFFAGEFYRAALRDHGDDPGDPEQLDAGLDALLEQHDEDGLRLTRGDRRDAMDALRAGGKPTEAASVDRVARALHRAKILITQSLLQRAQGDWSIDTTAGRFPDSLTPTHSQALACSFGDLLRGWAADRGHSVDARPIHRAVYERQRTLERFGSFQGHRDAARVTKQDVARWKRAMVEERKLSPVTVAKDISELSAIWKWGVANGHSLPSGNVFEGMLPKQNASAEPTRRPFTEAEATAILLAVRRETGLLRWLPFVCCLTGARLTEVVQSHKEDIATKDGVRVLHVHASGPGRSLKNAASRRAIPIHPALVTEGFIAYVEALPAGSPLFPLVKTDRMFGTRSRNAGRLVSRWLKAELGIVDLALSANHSWRHFFTDACRVAGMHEEVRKALTGHAKVDVSSRYGLGMEAQTAVLFAALSKVRLPPGV